MGGVGAGGVGESYWTIESMNDLSSGASLYSLYLISILPIDASLLLLTTLSAFLSAILLVWGFYLLINLLTEAGLETTAGIML